MRNPSSQQPTQSNVRNRTSNEGQILMFEIYTSHARKMRYTTGKKKNNGPYDLRRTTGSEISSSAAHERNRTPLIIIHWWRIEMIDPTTKSTIYRKLRRSGRLRRLFTRFGSFLRASVIFLHGFDIRLRGFF